jgi:hypothetical protein
MIIVLEGADGVGKTYLAKEICKRLDAKYIHATYRYKDHQFLYHTAIAHVALEHVRKYHKPVVIDRWWISESVYAEVYRGGTKWPLMGRYMDRIMRKVGGVYVFCLHDGNLDDYGKKFDELKSTRYEMYKDTRDVADIYKGLWEGRYDGLDTYANQISEQGGFYRREDALRYSIEKEGKDIPAFCQKIIDKMKEPSLIDFDNFTGSLINSKFLLIGDEICHTQKGKLSWPFHKHGNSGLFLTKWLNEHQVNEADLAWVNIHEKNGRENILSWLANNRGKVICLGNRAYISFKKFFPRMKCAEVIHPQAAARFPFNRDIFERQMKKALNF